MGNFLRGLLIGVGIALLVAPRRGQEQRRILGERLQKLRAYLSERVQSNPTLQQGADRLAQTASSVKDTASQAANQVKQTTQQATAQVTTQAKQTAQQVATRVQETAQNVTQQAAQAKNTVQNTAAQAATQAKQAQETVKNSTQQAAANGKSAVVDAAHQASTQAKQTVQSAQASTATTKQTSLRKDTGLDTPVSEIPGMEPEPLKELEAEGIHTTGQLLEQTATKEMRSELAQKMKISTHMLRSLVDRADLMRLPGISREMATLLEEAGVNGCKDLQHRNPEHLHATLIGQQESTKSASLTPGVDELTQWIAEATAVTHTVRS